MLFNSFEFLFFLPLVFLLYWFVFKPLKWQNLFIVIASYTFYGWWDWRFLLLMALTTFCSFLSGILLERNEHHRQKQNLSVQLTLFSTCLFFAFSSIVIFWRESGCTPQVPRMGSRLDYTRHITARRYQFLYFSSFKLHH